MKHVVGLILVTLIAHFSHAQDAGNLIQLNGTWSLYPKKSEEVKFVVNDNVVQIKANTGVKVGGASQMLKLAPGSKVQISGSLKRSDSAKKGMVALQCFDKNWKQVKYIVVFTQKDGSDWGSFNKKITLPDNAERVLAVINLNGGGEVSVKDFKVIAL